LQKRIQRAVDDANDEVKIQREGESEEKRKREKRKEHLSFEGLDENPSPSGAATPRHNHESRVPSNILEAFVGQLHRLKSHGSSDESGSSSETSKAGTKERGPR